MHKNILIVANGTLSIYKFRKELIKNLVTKKNKVYLSAPNDGMLNELLDIGVEYIPTILNRHGMNPVEDFKLLLHYKKIIKNINPDIVLTYTIKPTLYFNIVAKNKVPVISTITGLGSTLINGGITSRIVLVLYKIAFQNNLLKISFQNNEDIAFFKLKGLLKSNNYFFVPGSGVNLKEFTYTPMEETNTVNFIYVGRIMKEKGITELLTAFNKIKGKYKESTRLVIIGYGDDETLEQVKKQNDQGTIEYKGFQNNIKSFVANSHCVILPSYKEGMSNSLLEAAAMGRPLIATDVSGCQEIIDNGKNGYLCKPKDVDTLLKAVEKFILLPFEEKQIMGSHSRAKVEKEFDRNIVVNKMNDEIEKILRCENGHI